MRASPLQLIREAQTTESENWGSGVSRVTSVTLPHTSDTQAPILLSCFGHRPPWQGSVPRKGPETQTEGGRGGPRGPPLWEKLGCEREKGRQAVIEILQKRSGDGRRCRQTCTVSEDGGGEGDGPRGRTHNGVESLEGAKQGWLHTGQKSRKISSQALRGEE